MKLKARIGEADLDIELDRRDAVVRAVVDGRPLEMEVSEPEPGVFLFKRDALVVEAVVSAAKDGEQLISLKGEEISVKVFDARKLSASGRGDAESDGKAEIRTAMPGKVVRILTAEGDLVEKGDGVIVVEAMKMQNELKSPKAGVVKKVSVPEGSTVGAGDVLVVIE
jgi:biotin carboxyl carrier protein